MNLFDNQDFLNYIITIIISPFACAIFSFLIGSKSKWKKWINYKKCTISKFYIYAMIIFILITIPTTVIAMLLSFFIFYILQYKLAIIILSSITTILLIKFISTRKAKIAKLLMCLACLIILFDVSDNNETAYLSFLLILTSVQLSKKILILFDKELSIEDKIPKKVKQFFIITLYLIIQWSIFNTTPQSSRFFNTIYPVVALPSFFIFLHDTTTYHYSKCSISYTGKELNGIDLSKIARKSFYMEIKKSKSKICIFLDKIDHITFYGEPVVVTSASYMYIILSKIKSIYQTILRTSD